MEVLHIRRGGRRRHPLVIGEVLAVWLCLAAASAGAQSLIPLDGRVFNPGDQVVFQPPQRGPAEFYLVRIAERLQASPLSVDLVGPEQTGRVGFAAPVAPGEYEVHVVANGGLVAKTVPFTVAAATARQPARPRPPAAAEAGGPVTPVTNAEGNWNIVWHDYPEKGQTTKAAAVLSRTWEIKCTDAEGEGCRYVNQLADSRWTLSATTDFVNWGGGTPVFKPYLEIKWGYGFLGHWGGVSKLRQTGPNELVGEWTYGDSKGKEVWTRAVPVVREVVFTTTTSKSTWTQNGPPGRVEVNPGESFSVKVFGDDLWGHQLLDLGGAIDLEPRSPFGDYLLGTVSRQAGGRYVFKETGSLRGGQDIKQVIGIQRDVVLRPKFSPGKKEVRVGGISVPFELVLAASLELRSVVKTARGFEPAPEGADGPVYIEAIYKTAQSGSTRLPKLELDGNTRITEVDEAGKERIVADYLDREVSLTLHRQSATVFRSRPIVITPRNAAEGGR